jgi:glycerol-3-phosphate acyltransferase PlsX
MQTARLGIDLMGSDTPPEELLGAVVSLGDLSAEIVLLGSEAALASCPPSYTKAISEETISMDDNPGTAVRQKRLSSMMHGLKLLREGRIDALISAGNTGALLLGAKTILDTLPGIDRPALLTLLPTRRKEMAVVDVGANLTLKAHHILQLAAMGIAYQKSRGVEKPTVGLLNIGIEAKKGTPALREAYQTLETLNRSGEMVFVGNIEGRNAFHGDVDVLVTDGFTGNIFLKTAEGIAAFILEELEEASRQEDASHLKKILSKLYHRLYYADHAGALLCGVGGIVVKCHGDTSPEAFKNGVRGALRLVSHDFLSRIKRELKEFAF